MTVPTIPLSDIINKWRDAINTSTDISDFCTDNYQKDPTIFVGLNKKDPPSNTDYPVIILRPGTKIEGEDEPEFQYAISVGWGIIEDGITASGNIKELDGISKCDDLGQLILQDLAEVNPSYPVSTVEYEIEAIEFFPKIIGEMVIQLTITPTLGAELSY